MSREIQTLGETLHILETGYYRRNGETIPLRLSPEKMRKAIVLLPDDVRAIRESSDFRRKPGVRRRTGFSCENIDSFGMACLRQRQETSGFAGGTRKMLVLNFANPVHPGGGVRTGARAQEEDLCRKSSLLLSLESGEAASYYRYNASLKSLMGSDAMILSPDVEIIRDSGGDLMEETVTVSVLTCAAPVFTFEMRESGREMYLAAVKGRMEGMLAVAAHYGYTDLVLGAWGCGAFGNDARVISDLFFETLRGLRLAGLRERDVFSRVDFAVLDRSPEQYNYLAFSRYFTDERYNDTGFAQQGETPQQAAVRDRIRGCLLGGAIGDALGYPVEFLSEPEIESAFGPSGITEYSVSPETSQAVISDDTQMTLFTANGILIAEAGRSGGGSMTPAGYTDYCYRDWLETQKYCRGMQKGAGQEEAVSWLMEVRAFYAWRAPGNTCLSAMTERQKDGAALSDYIASPLNRSKGCGGIMRTAPAALRPFTGDIRALELESAQMAAITHSHPLGYMPSAVLTHILYAIVHEGRTDLPEIVKEAGLAAAELFAGNPDLDRLAEIMQLALSLSENDRSDLENIHRIGEGWVGEETLGISLYCALRHTDSFSDGIIAAVNHKGDSDSTGAVTGNILGALHGCRAIDEKWKRQLELRDVILELADDLACPHPLFRDGHFTDPYLESKYARGVRTERQ